ncbi:DUF475 domain-containing protein [Microtetraspora niveoalba]|uniref:DUF475 domain-containing protein n=1 Tax=Microtetraspora niveoalba TaxID=46175 RepID=UPI000833C81B|nr:DUF475 domain-containing protein [Microtetraspora niveoalba]
MTVRDLRWPLAGTAAGLLLALLLGGPGALVLVVILAVLEISLSFDNAVVNAKVIERMSPHWRRMFLTVGIAVAVFGMRLVFPLLIVGVTARLTPAEALALALSDPAEYGVRLHEAHPLIAAFGGMFLFMIFLDFVFEDRQFKWLVWLERPLARIGKLDQLSVVVALAVLLTAARVFAAPPSVVVAGVLGIMTYLLVNGLGELFQADGVAAAGKAGFFLFLYLEVLDASFSFDGVIGAFAISHDLFLITLGLGIGAVYIRSFTIFLVRRGTLGEYVYLEHGAHWAIGALAGIMLLSLGLEIPEMVTGLIGLAFIGTSMASSAGRNRRAGERVEESSGAAAG